MDHVINHLSVLSEQVLNMFRAYPSLIVDHCPEITDFVTLRNLTQAKEEFFLHMVSELGYSWYKMNLQLMVGVADRRVHL